jgi:predicted PhzF superfamily epimerase YddE/YHI9
MKLKLWQVDAFAGKPLEGNPAAIVPLERWIDANLMQKIANENNLAETAFFVRTAPGQYDLRWFTPESEVDLCGHATLASAWLLFDRLDPEQSPSGLASSIGEALGAGAPAEILKGRYLFAVWPKAHDVRAISGPGDIGRILRSVELWGLIATAPGDAGYDFVSRFFAPDKGVPEDPVTGSAHCALAPYWAKRLGKTTLRARQVSPRGGDVTCKLEDPRTVLSGPCALYLTGEIEV